MGATKEQKVAHICSQVAWLGWRDRVRVLRALVFSKATDEQGRRIIQ